MMFDWGGGIVRAALCRFEKSKSGALCAANMFHCGVRKFWIFIMIALADILDAVMLPGTDYIRSIIIGYYIANEASSMW